MCASIIRETKKNSTFSTLALFLECIKYVGDLRPSRRYPQWVTGCRIRVPCDFTAGHSRLRFVAAMYVSLVRTAVATERCFNNILFSLIFIAFLSRS